MKADLIVDAAGRGSRLVSWLEELGYPVPSEEKLDVDIVYTTRTYRREPAHFSGELNMIVTTTTPEIPRGGLAQAIEDDQWLVVLFGYYGDHAGGEDADFSEFARSLASGEIYELIRTAEPRSEPVQYRFPASRRRHFQNLKCFPSGLLGFGDVLCRFNPIYGQGINVAAKEAIVLQSCLAHSFLAPPPSLMYPRIALRVLWQNLLALGRRQKVISIPVQPEAWDRDITRRGYSRARQLAID